MSQVVVNSQNYRRVTFYSVYVTNLLMLAIFRCLFSLFQVRIYCEIKSLVSVWFVWSNVQPPDTTHRQTNELVTLLKTGGSLRVYISLRGFDGCGGWLPGGHTFSRGISERCVQLQRFISWACNQDKCCSWRIAQLQYWKKCPLNWKNQYIPWCIYISNRFWCTIYIELN